MIWQGRWTRMSKQGGERKALFYPEMKNVAQHCTKQNSAGDHSTAQHSTAQHSAAQCNAAQHRKEQNNGAGEHSTAQRNAALRGATQRSTAQHSIGPHCTSLHSTTAQHGTAQYSTEQRSEAQRNAARHNTAQRNTVQHSTQQNRTAGQHCPAQHSGTQCSHAEVTSLSWWAISVFINQHDRGDVTRSPDKCHLSEWTAWTQCTKPCNSGKKFRYRKITSDGANHEECRQQKLKERKRCNTKSCNGGCWKPASPPPPLIPPLSPPFPRPVHLVYGPQKAVECRQGESGGLRDGEGVRGKRGLVGRRDVRHLLRHCSATNL